MLSQLGADGIKQAKQLTILSVRIASRVYPNQQFAGQVVQSGGTQDRGVNIVSVRPNRTVLFLLHIISSSWYPCFLHNSAFYRLFFLHNTAL